MARHAATPSDPCERLEPRRLLSAAVDVAWAGVREEDPATLQVEFTADVGASLDDADLAVHNLTKGWAADRTLPGFAWTYDAADDRLRLDLGEPAPERPDSCPTATTSSS